MKKLFTMLFCVGFLSISGFSQQNKVQVQTKETKQQKNMDCCLMKNGKMYFLQNGKEAVIEKDMKLKSGVMVSPDGTCKMKNGKMMKLKEGECCDMMGIVQLHAKHIKKP